MTFLNMKTVFFLFVFIPSLVFSTLTNNTPDVVVSGLTAWRVGGVAAGNGKLLVVDGYDSKLCIITPVPTANKDVDVVSPDNVRVTGCTQFYQSNNTSPCIAGNKLFLSDSDPVKGWVIRGWNTIPTSNTTIASADFVITGFVTPAFGLRTDGTKFACISYYTVFIWNTIPDTNADTLTANTRIYGYTYTPYNMSFGKSGKIYINWESNSPALGTKYISIFNNVPAGPTNVATNNKRIVINSAWGNGGIYSANCAWEDRNLTWVVYFDVTANTECVLIYKDDIIDTANYLKRYYIDANTTLFSDFFTDGTNIYTWSNNNTVVSIYKNDIGVLHTSATNLSPSYSYSKQQNVLIQKLKFFADGYVVRVNSLKFDILGTAASSDVSYVKLYKDSNSNETYDAGTDVQVGQSVAISSASALLQNLALDVNANDTVTLFVAIDVAETATVGNTFGLKMSSDSSVTISDTKDYVWPDYFPMQSGLTTFSDSIPPSAITTLSAYTGTSEGEITLKWTKPYENINIQKYVIVRADSKISSDAEFTNATVIDDNVSMSGSTEENYTVKGLVSGKKYFFCVKTIDVLGNVSDISNSAFARAYSSSVVGAYYSADTIYSVIISNPLYPATTITISPESLSSAVIISMEKLDGINLTEEQVADMAKHSEILRDEILALWELTTISPETSEKIENEFLKPVKLTFGYSDKLPKSYKEENNHIAVYRWNDTKKTWESKGGFIDRQKHTVAIYTKKFSTYGVFVLKGVENLSVEPNPFTPNGDGINDRIYFVFPDEGKAKISIFDINGKLIFHKEEAVSGEAYWDGIEQGSNKYAESGMYLCVIESSNHKYVRSVILSK